MNEESRYILLTIIQNNGNIDDLIDSKIELPIIYGFN